MTPKFWKYLVNNCNGSTIRFVAEQDRDRAEKELEGNTRLLSYHAKPQIQSSVFRRPTERVLRQLQRARVHLQTREVNQMHDAVVTINNTHWPAYRRETGTLVDLRLFDPNDPQLKTTVDVPADALRESGIPDALIEAAARSNPPGLVLFEDAPQFEGCTDQPTSESTR